MPAYKDKKTGTWYVKFYYMDYNGSRRQKMKRGFLLKRDALTWEREFLHKASGSSEMSFASLAELYLEDLKANRKHSSFVTANSTLKNRILPTFGDVPISAISPGMIRRWQNDLMNTNLSASYINRIDGVFRAVIAFAVRYCGLKESPIENTKRAGEAKSEEMKFYTAEQYERFIATFKPGSRHRLIFNMLFYTGCRIGELLAITAGDIDLEHETMRISKTWDSTLGAATKPKTKKSNRTVALPPFLCEELKGYIARCPEGAGTRLFDISPHAVRYELKVHATKAGLPVIRVHDLRHSHASLLISLGLPPEVVADRLGHGSIAITLSVYTHMYPNRQRLAADALENLQNPDDT